MASSSANQSGQLGQGEKAELTGKAAIKNAGLFAAVFLAAFLGFRVFFVSESADHAESGAGVEGAGQDGNSVGDLTGDSARGGGANLAAKRPAYLQRDIAPWLVVNPATYDFGRMRQGAEQTAFFEVRNRGERLISIGAFEHSCECLHPRLEKTKLRPGETAVLEVLIESEGLGTYTYHMEIPSDDPVRSKIKMSFNAEVLPILEVEPKLISFGKVEGSAAASRSFTIRHLEGKPFKVVSLEPNRKDFVVEGCEADAAGSRYTVRVAAKPLPQTLEKSSFVMGMVTIKTDLKGVKPFDVRLSMQVK